MRVYIELEKGLPAHSKTSGEQLMEYFKEMYTMRRVEITCDNEYKVRFARAVHAPRACASSRRAFLVWD
jgi:hypothetical protein